MPQHPLSFSVRQCCQFRGRDLPQRSSLVLHNANGYFRLRGEAKPIISIVLAPFTKERSGKISTVCEAFLLAFSLTFLAETGYGQVFDFRSYTVREGLLSNAVTALCQDSFGYLWVGTGDGVSVYDGATFRNYTVADGLASSLVNCIVEDRNEKGTMWIGTNGGGVSKFRDGEFTNYRLGASDWPNRVNSIAQARDGTVYCTADGGIYTVRNGVASALLSGPNKRPITEIASRGDSLVYINQNGLLTSYNLKDGARHRLALTWLRESDASMFVFDSKNRLWVSLDDGTLINITDGIAVHHVLASPPEFIVDDDAGNLWVGTTDGLYKFQENNFGKYPPVHLTTANGLPQNDMTTGLLDVEGDLWLGSVGDGLYKLTDQNSCTFPIGYTDIALNNSQGGSDGFGHIWVVGDTALLEVWRGSFGSIESRVHPFKELGIEGLHTSLHITDGTKLWLGSSRGVIRCFEIRPIPDHSSKLALLKSYFVNKSFPNISPLCFWVDRDNRIWYSLDKIGVLEFDAGTGLRKFRIYSPNDGLPDNSIRTIFEDSNGSVWFGGYIGGLSELNPSMKSSKMRLYTTKDGLPDNSIRSIIQDDSGNLWIGTRYGGAAEMRNGRFKYVSVKDGLISNGIWSMAYDKRHGMIFGTQLGLQILQNADRHANRWQVFGKRAPVYSCGITSSNLLWACGPSGITVTDISEQSYSRTPPFVYITGLLVNGEAVRFDHSLQLPYDKNTVTFDFAGVSLKDEKDLTYRYILQGADNKWRFSLQAHPVTYVSLKSGRYLFEVRAVKPSGLESTNPAILSLVIVAPYWQRWWFVTAVAIFLISLIYFAVRIRIRRLLEIERVRARIATDLHDDIGSGLTRIAILADVARRQTDLSGVAKVNEGEPNKAQAIESFATHNLLQKIGANARELVDSMSDVVWSIDPKNIKVGELLKRLRSFAHEMCEPKGIALSFEIDSKLETMRLDAEVLRTLLLITKESLNNAVKHSGCKLVRIRIRADGRRIELKLADDGCGFLDNSHSDGHGLENMRKRAEKLGGSFKVKSSTGEGTIIDVLIPTHN